MSLDEPSLEFESAETESPIRNKPDAAAIVAEARARRRKRWFYRLFGLLVVVSSGGYLAWSRWGRPAGPTYEFLTREVRRGDLRETVTATGTLKGLDTVDVGAQISGRIERVLVDFNDRVKAGQVLAEIDTTQLRSRVEQSRAQLKAAEASLRLARASLTQSRAQLARTRELYEKGIASSRELETAEADAERAEASVASSEAQTALARASLKDAETSLSYATIRSPIDGIVLARLVEPGQTVAASLQAPVLFTLARDLTQLRLYVDLDEADVSRVKEGQSATFTVEAWPNRTFPSRVLSVHNLPTSGQSVVTYQAVLAVDNRESLFRPGMTATSIISTSERKNVLLVPNAALRFTPPIEMPREQSALSILPGMRGPPWPRGSTSSASSSHSQGVVWVLEQGRPRRQPVEIGGTDGEWTEIAPGKLRPGTRVVVDVEQRKKP